MKTVKPENSNITKELSADVDGRIVHNPMSALSLENATLYNFAEQLCKRDNYLLKKKSTVDRLQSVFDLNNMLKQTK